MMQGDRVILINKRLKWSGYVQDTYKNDNIIIHQVAWDGGFVSWELEYTLKKDVQTQREIIIKNIIS